MRVPIQIAPSNAGNELIQADSKLLVNMYSEPSTGKAPFILKKRPGLDYELALAGTFAIRGHGTYTTSTERMFAIRGASLYEVYANGTSTLRGSLGTNTGLVSFADNGVYMVIADGSSLRTYNLDTNALTTVSDAQAPSTTPQTAFIDGFCFGYNPNAAEIGEYQWSLVDDPTSWESIDTGYAEKVPDKLVSMVANNGDLWLFGSQSYEVHGNTGALTNTWTLIGGAVGEIGCAARFSVAKHSGSVYWLGASKEGYAQIYRSVGYQAQKISTFNEDTRIAAIYDISDANGFTYQIDGHAFYKITFQSGDLTLVYDITTGLWHDETWWNDITMLQERSREISHNFFDGKNWFGDGRNGNLYTLSNAKYQDYNNPIICEMRFPHFEDMKQALFFHSLELDIETGVGDNDTAPEVQLCYSDDGGYTYSMWRNFSLGKRGDTLRRIKANRLGRSRFGERIFKVRFSGNTRFTVMNKAIAEIESGV